MTNAGLLVGMINDITTDYVYHFSDTKISPFPQLC